MARKSSVGVLKALEKILGPVPGQEEFRPLERIILMLLAHGSDPAAARTAVKKLKSEYVDWNEVRVSSPYEIQQWLKGLGKLSERRAGQIKEVLVFAYTRFNKLSLECLLHPEPPPEERRKRDRFEAWILDKAKAIVVEERGERRRRGRPPAAKAKGAASPAGGKTRRKAAAIGGGKAPAVRKKAKAAGRKPAASARKSVRDSKGGAASRRTKASGGRKTKSGGKKTKRR